MPTPKDWFRRRRSVSVDSPSSDPVDPFAGEGILELGDNAARLRLEGETRDPAPARHIAAVPPPPPRPGGVRDGRVIERSAFAMRPEIARQRPEPELRAAEPQPPARPSAPGQVHEMPGRAERREAAVAAFTPRRSAAFRIDPVAMRGAARPVPLATAAPAAEAMPEREEPQRKAQSERRAATPLPPSPAATPPTATANLADASGAEENPAFTLAAPGASWMRTSRPASVEAGRLNALLRDAFTPTRPKQSAALFSGRYKQMQRIIAAIEEERAHVVIYGERGSGKTSLANVLAGKAEEAGYYVLRFACSSELTFEDIFRSLLRRIPVTFLADGMGAGNRAGIDNFEQLLPTGHIGIAELVAVFERIYDRHVILIIDEYDRVTSEEVKHKLAELIKIMSDASAPVTLLLIGVADDVQELFGKHPSLQRTLVTVPMPLMSRREMGGIIAAGEEKTGLHFEPEVRQSIIDFAQGLPYHAQLLCLFAARNAVRRRSSVVERQDLRYAVLRAGEDVEPRIRDAYDLAVVADEQHSFEDALFFAARCKTDEFGVFGPAEVAAAQAADSEASLLSLQYLLKKLSEPERGAMLRRLAGPAGQRYQFCSQMMRHYVLLRQAEQRGLI